MTTKFNILDFLKNGTPKTVVAFNNSGVPIERDLTDEDVEVANSTASYDIDYDLAQNFVITLTDNATFTISNPPTNGGAFTLFLEQDATGSRTVTWPASIIWPGGTAPTLTGTANSIDVIVFVTNDGGTTWQGYVAGLDLQ